MDEKALAVAINAGKSLFGIIVINGQMRFIMDSELINSFSHHRYDKKILEIDGVSSDSMED